MSKIRYLEPAPAPIDVSEFRKVIISRRSVRKFTDKPIPAEVLDDVMYKAIAIGFAFFTIATILGALWAAEAWGTYWQWDPKETWAFIVWLNYATWLHRYYRFRGIKTQLAPTSGAMGYGAPAAVAAKNLRRAASLREKSRPWTMQLRCSTRRTTPQISRAIRNPHPANRKRPEIAPRPLPFA